MSEYVRERVDAELDAARRRVDAREMAALPRWIPYSALALACLLLQSEALRMLNSDHLRFCYACRCIACTVP